MESSILVKEESSDMEEIVTACSLLSKQGVRTCVLDRVIFILNNTWEPPTSTTFNNAPIYFLFRDISYPGGELLGSHRRRVFETGGVLKNYGSQVSDPANIQGSGTELCSGSTL